MIIDDIKYDTSTNLADVESSKIHDITTMEVVKSSEVSILSTMIVNQAERCKLLTYFIWKRVGIEYKYNFLFQDRNYTLLNPIEYEQSSGHPLGNTLYWNDNLYCLHDGYVSSIYLRLFTNWTGNAPLYVFIMEASVSGLGLKQRYVIQPQRHTTDWQIINIPSDELPISVRNFLAIGMQDSSNTNQIYGVKSAAQETVMGLLGKNVSPSTTLVDFEGSPSLGFALGYTMVTTGKKIFY
jgi:hypothetical protein